MFMFRSEIAQKGSVIEERCLQSIKKNKKKCALKFKRIVALKAADNKRKVEAEKKPDVWNA